MPSIDRPSTPQQSREGPTKEQSESSPLVADQAPLDKATFVKKGLETARSYKSKRKQKATVKEIDFFERDAVVIDEIPTPKESHAIDYQAAMLKSLENTPSGRRPLRLDQDGPWSVSVAENPDDARSYSLYIKTTTHNLTLTRTAMELVELDHKLRDGDLAVSLPSLPLDAATIAAQTPPKRKSTFLNTLSRLASPTTHRSRAPSSRHTSNVGGPPATATDSHDPFTTFSPSTIDAALPPPSTTSTAVAAYLTTISNLPSVRQTRVWKRFIRVRTDDLESVRVERAIKRVRSDLAAHVGSTKGEKENRPSVEVGKNLSQVEALGLEENKEKMEEVPSSAGSPDAIVVGTGSSASSLPPPPPPQPQPVSAVASVKDEDEEPPTPHAPEAPVARVRSLSADAEKRISRAFTSSDIGGMSSQPETGDESSASATDNRRAARKKRSLSTDPNRQLKKSQRKVGINDFEMMRVLGKGCAGKVLLVRHKSSSDLYALKAITKRHVLAHQELQHTLTEQAVLKKMAAESKDPFVVKLWWSFHDKENLFLVMDFHPGGDLATQLARWGRLGRDRARFYAAEIVEGVEGLHAAGVIYRDLKPENILIGGDGHIVLTDFGLSKEFPRRTTAATAPSTPTGSRSGEFFSTGNGANATPVSPPWMKADKTGELALGWPGAPVGHSDSTTTFCGTAEYLAPEVIQGLPYSYEIDWWSFGTMLYEMLTGITPFWANNHSDMYVRVLQDELQFPDDRAIDQDTKSLIRGLLQRNPGLRICEPRIKRHPYFSMIDWSHVYYKRYIPPYIPPTDPSNASDTQNFDDTFLDMEPVLDDANEGEATDTDQERGEQTDTDRTDGDETNTTPSQSRSSSVHPRKSPEEEDVDVFDGYSFKGRHSVLLDDDSDGSEETDEDSSAVNSIEEESSTSATVPSVAEEDEDVEPKTPEARQASLPADTAAPATSTNVPDVAPEETIDVPAPAPTVDEHIPDLPSLPSTPEKETPALPPVIPPKEEKTKPVVPPKPATKAARPIRNPRREKSGVTALDRYMSDTVDEDTGLTGRDEEEDEDWDIVEAADGEDRNGAKGTSYFARGVVDRYRMAVVFRKSTPSRQSAGRSFSGMSKDSDFTEVGGPESPTPSQRRGRNQGLNFRKHPRQFLRPKSPPSSFSAKSARSSLTAKSMNASNTASLSTGSSSGMLVSSLQSATLASAAGSPSLKSKESALSVGAQSYTSDQSGNGDLSESPAPQDSTKVAEEPEKQKNKKLKKYKENAEKVFSLFSGSSPRQP